MTYRGVVIEGRIVLENAPPWPEGTRVEVIVPEPAAGPPTLAFLLKYAGTANDLPEDMAAQHDHYLHKTAKR